MPCRHIFGDLECEAGGRRPEPGAAFAHPKAEGLFGQKRYAKGEAGAAAPAEGERAGEGLLARH